LNAITIIWKSLIDFYKDDGLMLAGSMSYFTMMAIVPFFLFLTTLFGYFLGHYPEFYRFIIAKMVNLFPDVTNKITQDISKLISYKGIGKFSIVLYGLLSYQLFSSFQNALNLVFKIKKKRNFMLSLFISLLTVTVIMLMLLTSFAAATFIPLLKTFNYILPDLKISVITAFIIRFILPFLLVLFILTMMYFLLPRTKVRLINSFKGAFFTAIMFEAAKNVFTWYVVTVAQFGKIYGPLSAFIVFLLWVFYSCSIFLIGAELVHNLSHTARKQGAR
jgi:membrane protein